MSKSHQNLVVGDRVQAIIKVYDLPGKDFGPPHPRAIAKYGASAAHVHALPGELGTVVNRDDEIVTVTFDRTGTTSDVVQEEVTHVADEWLEHSWKNVLHHMSPFAQRLSWEQTGDLARMLGYFYYVWNDRVIISRAGSHRPLDTWPMLEEFFGE